MRMGTGEVVFVAAPIALGLLLAWLDPKCRRVRPWQVAAYLVVMSLVLWGALRFVAYMASARVVWSEVLVVLWFMIGWRFAWAIWTRTVGRWGQARVRWARLRRRAGRSVPWPVRLIPLGRAALTVVVFFPVFLTMIVTHRCKLPDGQDPFSTFNMRFDRICIPTRDGLVLDGWFIPDYGATRTIVVCHGAGANKGNFVWFLGPLANQGYNVLFFDFRAHGGSDGRLATYGIRERLDVLAAVDWLKRERPKQSRVIVGLGSSQGAMALALAAAEDQRIDAVILDSPFTSPRELVHSAADRVPLVGPVMADWLLLLCSLQAGADFLSTSAEQAVASLGSRPVIVIHGSEDIMMPASHTQRLYDAAKGPKAIWFGPGPHSNIITTAPDEYAARVFVFLEKCLGRPARPYLPRTRQHSAPASAAAR